MTHSEQSYCGMGCAAGAFGEMLLCGFLEGHGGPHSWSSLPTFIDGRPVFPKLDRPLASVDVELAVTQTKDGEGRWCWEVRDLTTARRTTRFDWESTPRKAWIRALAVARAEFRPKGSSS